MSNDINRIINYNMNDTCHSCCACAILCYVYTYVIIFSLLIICNAVLCSVVNVTLFWCADLLCFAALYLFSCDLLFLVSRDLGALLCKGEKHSRNDTPFSLLPFSQ